MVRMVMIVVTERREREVKVGVCSLTNEEKCSKNDVCRKKERSKGRSQLTTPRNGINYANTAK